MYFPVNELGKVMLKDFKGNRLQSLTVEQKLQENMSLVKTLREGETLGEFGALFNNGYAEASYFSKHSTTQCLVCSFKDFMRLFGKEISCSIEKDLNLLKAQPLFKQSTKRVFIISTKQTFTKRHPVFIEGQLPEAVYITTAGEFTVTNNQSTSLTSTFVRCSKTWRVQGKARRTSQVDRMKTMANAQQSEFLHSTVTRESQPMTSKQATNVARDSK